MAQESFNEESDLSYLRYARGYVAIKASERESLQNASEEIPKHWVSKSFAGWIVWFDPRLEMTSVEEGENAVLFLGHAIDLDDKTDDCELIVRKLVASSASSTTKFQDELDRLNGRFLVIIKQGDSLRCQSDASSLRSVYFSAEKAIIASHQNIVAKASGSEERSVYGTAKWWRENRAVTYPAFQTCWKTVRYLLPNHQLDLQNMVVERVFLPPPESASIKDIVERLDADFSTQLEILVKTKNPVVSLTAGQDSRVTLAATRAFADRLNYFTYGLVYSKRQRAVQIDLEASAEIARIAGVEKSYKQLIIDGPLEEGPIRDILAQNSPRHSNLNVAARYLFEYPDTDYHIRSSMNEVASARYRGSYEGIVPGVEDFSDLFTFKRGYSIETADAMREYLEVSEPDKQSGYDAFDLYYWEIRMGSWLGNILHESDCAFDTHILVNSRSIYRYLLAPSLEDRKNHAVYNQYIREKWFDISTIPINGGVKK